MYKSFNSQILKYLIPVLMLAGTILGTYATWSGNTPESSAFAKSMIPVIVCSFIFLFQMPFRLKNIQTTDAGLLVTDFGKETLIAFKDIKWISKFDLTNPSAITIKYQDVQSRKFQKISFIPQKKDQRVFADDAMTDFIRNKIMQENPNYSKEEQPSTLKNLIVLALLALPFGLLAIYFQFAG